MILFVVILVNGISCSPDTDEITTIQSNTDDSVTTESMYERAMNEILKIKNQLITDKEQLKNNQKKLKEEKKLPKSIKKTDVIQLNVGGEIMMTTRETLTRVPKSLLFMLFNGRWEHKLHGDPNGIIFLDFNPIIFRHLLDQLQTLNTLNTIHFHPPSEPSLVIPFQKMLRKLGLHQLLSREKKMITLNVGGQTIINRLTTFRELSDSALYSTISSSLNITKFVPDKSDLFVDYNPKVFQHLIDQLREESFKSVCPFDPSLQKENIFYKNMLADFGICRGMFRLAETENIEIFESASNENSRVPNFSE